MSGTSHHCKPRQRRGRPTEVLSRALILTALVVGCSGGSPYAPVDPSPGLVPTTIAIVPAQVELEPGAARQFVARLADESGRPVSAPVQWSATGGTIDQSGRFVAGAHVGVYQVLAQSQQGSIGLAAGATVQVSPSRTTTPGERPAASVSVSPDDASVQTGETLQFTAQLKDDRGAAVSGSIRWQASGGTIGSDGTYRAGSAVGTFRVTAVSGLISGGVDVTIIAPPTKVGGPYVPAVKSITVSPAGAIAEPGDTLRFSADVRDQMGVPMAAALAWEATGGRIDASGVLVAGDDAGTSKVTATSGSVTGTVSYRVVAEGDAPPPAASPPPGSPSSSVPATVALQPQQADMLPGDVLQFSATVRDDEGNVLSVPVSWQATGGTISSTGRYTAGSATGSFKVTAVAGDVSAEAPIQISSAPPPPTSSPAPSGSVEVVPGTDLQGLVNSHGTGTTFFLRAGTHRRQSVSPKDGMTFIGETGAVMTGEGVTQYAFHPTANNVTIRNLVIERYASPLQMGAITAGGHTASEQRHGWVIEDCEVRTNDGGGIRLGDGMILRNSNIHHNGQIGLVGISNGGLIDGNEIAYNNTKNVNAGWEAGGTKFVASDGLVIRNNFVHHNKGKGLWTDIDNINILMEGNVVEDNTEAGIMHEISYRAVFRNNVVRRNGFGGPGWLWGGGIVIANSPDVEVYGNRVEDNADGITGIHQSRGTGRYGARDLRNLHVHDNTVKMSGSGDWNGQQTGIAQDTGTTAVFSSWGNRFVGNSYRLESLTALYFAWQNQNLQPTGWQALGQDLTGTFN